jgi:hypothetical protein
MKASIEPPVFAGLFRHKANQAVLVPADSRAGLSAVPFASCDVLHSVQEGGPKAGARTLAFPSDDAPDGGRVRAREPGRS